MAKLIVTAAKLNKRNLIPAYLPDANGIIGVVNKGFTFQGNEVTTVSNPSLGKWFKDRDGSFYWGGGLMVLCDRFDIHLPGMPINLPANYRLGIDVSHHNENLDWEAFKNAGVSFVFIKISEGVGTHDNKAKEHADKARAMGIRIGYYHFCRPDTRNGGTVISDATAEANDSLSIIETLQQPDLPLVLDLENANTWDTPLNQQDYLLWVTTFLNRIKEKSGIEAIIYSRKEYLDRKLPHNHNLGKYKFWVSYYPEHGDCNKVASPLGWNDWAIWQYTETGTIGRSAKLDINILKDPTLF